MSIISDIIVQWTPETSTRVVSAQIRSRIVGDVNWTEQAAATDPAAGTFRFSANAANADVEVQLRYRMIDGVYSAWDDAIVHTNGVTITYATILGTPKTLGDINATEGGKLGGVETGATKGASAGVNLGDGSGSILQLQDIKTSIGTAHDVQYVGGVAAADIISRLNQSSGGTYDTTPPDIPTNLSLSTALVAGTNPTSTVTATWTASTASDTAGYTLAISTNGGPYIQFDAGNTTTLTTSVPVNTVVSAKVLAVDSSGNRSGYSPASNITTPKDNVAPGPVSGLNATTSLGSAFLTWINPSDSDLATVEVFETTGTTAAGATLLATVNAQAGATASYTRSGLATGSQRNYFVRAVDTSGNRGVFAGPLAVTLPSLDPASIQIASIPTSAFQDGSLSLGGEGLLKNGGAETGDLSGWTGQGLLSQVGNGSSYSFALPPQTAGGFYSRAFPASPGKTYSVSWALRGGANIAGAYFRLAYSSTKPKFEVPCVTYNDLLAYGSATPAWVVTSTTWTAPTDAAWVSVGLYNLDANNTAYFDDIQIFELISGVRIAANSISTDKLVAASITSNKLAANSVTTLALAANSITSDKLSVNSVLAVNIAAGSVSSDKIAAGTITGDKISTSTSLPGSITVGNTGVSITTVASQAVADPVTRINAATTQIDPGRISIGGGLSLNSWRYGGNSTTIDGGAVAANTISSNKLTIGNRGITLLGCDFSYNRNDGRLYWSSGYIFFSDDNGAATSIPITAGSTAWLSGAAYVYIWWNKTNPTVLGYGGDNWANIINDSNNLLFCTWSNGVNFNANYGGTIVDGDRITTGSVNANRIVSATITSQQIASDSIDASRLHIGSRGLSFQDLIFQTHNGNSCSWTNGAAFWTDDNGNGQITGISAGSIGTPPPGNYYYIYWVKGSDHLDVITGPPTTAGYNAVHVATYPGGTNVIQLYGGTIIDGSNITTGTVNADKIVVGSISAQQIAFAGVNGGNIQVNAVTTFLAFANPNSYGGSGTGTTTAPGGGGGGGGFGGNKIDQYN